MCASGNAARVPLDRQNHTREDGFTMDFYEKWVVVCELDGTVA